MTSLDLAFNILLTLLFILFVSIPTLKDTPIRVFFGLYLVLFQTGYSLVATLFPKRNDLDGIERVGLSFGLSIIIVPLLSLVLSYTPLGIRLKPVWIIISVFSISFSVIAWIRRMKLPTDQKFTFTFDRSFNVKRLFNGHDKIDKILSIILIISVIASFATLIYILVMPKTGERFTEFYLLNSNGIASNYITDLKVLEEGNVIIGIVNHEYENVTYRLEINFNGSLIYEEYVLLIDNEIWEIPFTFKPTKKGENQKLEFLLYKDQQIEAYRMLHLWISFI